MSVTAPRGFVAGAVAAGIRRNGSADLAVIRSIPRAVGTAMFTTNQVQAAPVTVSRRHLAGAQPQAVVINSGVANAGTGQRGIADAEATAVAAGALLDLRKEEVLVLSTGLIGAPIPLDRITEHLPAAVASMNGDGGLDAAGAIMTTDTRPKHATATGDGFVVGGIAKGSGMIHPSLATMLAVVTTDCALIPEYAAEELGEAVERSFNRITVDGDQSTNDAVILLANGATGTAPSRASFRTALQRVCDSLARQIVADGEGATLIVEIRVTGAATETDAVAVARGIATSNLVKTAAFGRDPNWGRVLAAAGAARSARGPIKLDVDLLELRFNDTLEFAAGAPTGLEPDMSGSVLRIDLDLGVGDGSAGYLSTDLTRDYVSINADYTT